MRFFYVDVFTDRRWTGNPLAVFVDEPEDRLTDAGRQAIAREVGFSETTFVAPRPDAQGRWPVRIYTPAKEIPFAGHPTLGTASVIARELGGDPDRLVLALRVGPIPVEQSGGLWTMSQRPAVVQPPRSDRARVASLLGLTETDLGPWPVQFASTGLPCLVVPFTGVNALNRCQIDHPGYRRWLAEVGEGNLCAWAPTGDPELPVAVRVFVDDPGFAEDPATGSAAGNLTGYFLEHGCFGPEVEFWIGQGDAMGRPSRLHLSGLGRGADATIRVGGRVVPVASGDWTLNADHQGE